MPRIAVSIDTATLARLRRLARRKGMTQAEVLREAIARYEGHQGFAALAPGIEEFRSGDRATASRTRAALRRAPDRGVAADPGT